MRSRYSAAFTLASVAAAVGAIAHGLAPWPQRQRPFWVASLHLIVATGGVMAATAAAARLPQSLLRPIELVTALKCLLAAWIASRQLTFHVAVASYALDLAATFLLHRGGRPGDRAMREGVAISAMAAVIQRSGWRRGRLVNHNDAYHFVQVMALSRFHKGVLEALEESA